MKIPFSKAFWWLKSLIKSSNLDFRWFAQYIAAQIGLNGKQKWWNRQGNIGIPVSWKILAVSSINSRISASMFKWLIDVGKKLTSWNLGWNQIVISSILDHYNCPTWFPGQQIGYPHWSDCISSKKVAKSKSSGFDIFVCYFSLPWLVQLLHLLCWFTE